MAPAWPAPAVRTATAPSRLTTIRLRTVVFRATAVAAAGIGLAVGAGSVARAGLEWQVRVATQRIGRSLAPAPQRDGWYLPDGRFRVHLAGHDWLSVRMVMLGDSTSAGLGADTADGVPGVMLARAVSADLRRPVHVATYAMVGSGAADLSRQVGLALRRTPDLAVIVVGANDVRNRISPEVAVRELGDAVERLLAGGVAVVVGSCPDLSVVAPIPQPLRRIAGLWSRRMARSQDREVTRRGAIAVPLGRLVSPDFVREPALFGPDLFHPSAAGYARAVRALAPAATAVLHQRRPAGLVPPFSAQHLRSELSQAEMQRAS